ncbi:MAG: hypothetical protein CMO80_01625 [Verrucomicrobiales bacterium]|nr:hypothetical protein [Verrucomicrobiales bacterium]
MGVQRITLGVGNSLVAQTLDPRGKPVPEVAVRVWPWDRPAHDLWSGRTDKDGEFSWNGAKNGHVYTVSFHKPGHTSSDLNKGQLNMAPRRQT